MTTPRPRVSSDTVGPLTDDDLWRLVNRHHAQDRNKPIATFAPCWNCGEVTRGGRLCRACCEHELECRMKETK